MKTTKTTKTFKAWARKAGSNDQFVTTEVRSKSKKAATAWLIANGYEIDGMVY